MSTDAGKKGFHLLLLIVFSILICTAGVLAAQGNAVPPFFYVITALIVCPILARCIGRLFRRRWLAELGVLLLCGIGCMAAAWWTSRITPRQAFMHIFKTPPPPSATAMQSRRQFYDGWIWLLRCDMSESDFQSLVGAAGMNKVDRVPAGSKWTAEAIKLQWKMDIVSWSAIAYNFWPRTPPTGDVEIYESLDEQLNANNDVTITNIFRDKTTGRTWIVRLD
jgi:hypothetical protein